MKVNFYTSQKDAAASMFYIQSFEKSGDIHILDRDFEKYDVLLLMTYDHEYVSDIKRSFPNIKIGLIDPRGKHVERSAEMCDFLIVDSIEMQDYWSFLEKPMFRFVEYPVFEKKPVNHAEKETIRIGYHGNLIHLLCASETIKPALEELSMKYNIEMVVMHAFPSNSGVETWCPRNMKVMHIPWSIQGYNTLATCDIGLVPNNLRLRENYHDLTATSERFNYNSDDYVMRFKMSSNPGRIVVFGRLGIPTVCEMYPSSIEFAGNAYNQRALLAFSKDGWKSQIERLIKSKSLRNELAMNMQEFLENVTPENQNAKLLKFMELL
ncbi:MAG: hypothetical protein CMA72_09580 [Euryarchaeota archaeon]|nr:hypothetical protein [Euryarchaeota archaeon]|tara:strand:- start:19763 stop:20731 length:969 start_codon:yes stop_codon:yes gene_type:complete